MQPVLTMGSPQGAALLAAARRLCTLCKTRVDYRSRKGSVPSGAVSVGSSQQARSEAFTSRKLSSSRSSRPQRQRQSRLVWVAAEMVPRFELSRSAAAGVLAAGGARLSRCPCHACRQRSMHKAGDVQPHTCELRGVANR